MYWLNGAMCGSYLAATAAVAPVHPPLQPAERGPARSVEGDDLAVEHGLTPEIAQRVEQRGEAARDVVAVPAVETAAFPVDDRDRALSIPLVSKPHPLPAGGYRMSPALVPAPDAAMTALRSRNPDAVTELPHPGSGGR